MTTTNFSIDIVDFNDGHSPGGTTVGTKMAHYRNKQKAGFFSVFDEVLPGDWSGKAYDYAMERIKPWGTYVTTEDALNSSISAEDLWKAGEFEKAIALTAVRSLVVKCGGPLVGSDMQNIHGTAVWCLTSGYNDEVQYHIDYAELYRYETNIIYPPIYAGTCQVAPVYSQKDMKGGEFKANVQGLAHYAKFGYKCRLSTKEAFEEDLQSSDWLTVPYKHNRGIFHDGDFPHYAAEITSIQPHLKRVILGLNCFPRDIAECNLRAPEHSDAFNRTIKLYQRMASLGLPISSQSSLPSIPATQDEKGAEKVGSEEGAAVEAKESAVNNKGTKKKGPGLSVEEVKKNPALAKLLVQAARRMKEVQKEEAAAAAALPTPPIH